MTVEEKSMGRCVDIEAPEVTRDQRCQDVDGHFIEVVSPHGSIKLIEKFNI